MTRDYAVVAFTDCNGEPVAPEPLRSHYPGHPRADDHVAPAGLDERVKTWPREKGRSERPTMSGGSPLSTSSVLPERRCALERRRCRS